LFCASAAEIASFSSKQLVSRRSTVEGRLASIGGDGREWML
jgi:hypothetical protein